MLISVRMLHIFNDLLIIGKPLEIGGSSSNTSRSTLAVSDPSTSGTVGDLPDARTSSASDQEQRSLEAFRASSDSGKYSQWFSGEIWV